MDDRPAPYPTPTTDAAVRALLQDADADVVTTAAELTGIHLVGDDAVLELVLPRAAFQELELRIGNRYALEHEVDDDGIHVPVILSSSLTLTPLEVADFRELAGTALLFAGSVSLRVDEHADEHPWSVVATSSTLGGVFTAWGDSPAEALAKAAARRWDDTPDGGPAPTPPGGWPTRNGDPS